jgi:anti-anti-sigma regulatory factor
MNFEVELKAGFGIIHCHVDLSAVTADELYRHLNRLVAISSREPDFAILLDLRHQARVDASVAQELVRVSEHLRRAKRSLVLLHPPKDVLNQLGGRLACSDGPPEGGTWKSGVTPLVSEAVLIDALKNAVLQTCLTLCPTLAVQAEAPFVRGTGFELKADIAAALLVKGGVSEGSIVLGFPKGIYLAILGHMHGQRYTEITQDLEDGASELLNMVRSVARSNAKGYLISREIPEVASGPLLQRQLHGFQGIVVIPFLTPGGHFHCLIGLSPRE